MRKKDFQARAEKAQRGFERKQIYLPEDEYAMVMSELNTNLSEEDRQRRIVTKPIGDFYYTIINHGFNDYLIIGKRSIVESAIDLWESESDG